MKLSVIFFCTALAMVCIGCHATGHMAVQGSTQSAWTGGPTRPRPLPASDTSGVTLPIAADISLGINVAGIVDYLQSEPVLSPQPHRQPPQAPLIRWIQHF